VPQQANYLSNRMVKRFRRLEKKVRAARGRGGAPFRVFVDKHDNPVGMRRSARSCQQGALPQPYVEESDGSDDSDEEESDLDRPLM
jgi:hypothetical protein